MSRHREQMTVEIVVEHQHRDLGYPDQYHQWVLFGGDDWRGVALEVRRVDSLGRKNGCRTMRRLICNNTDCDGTALFDPISFAAAPPDPESETP